MAARASAVVITEAEAVGGAHGIIAGQVVHTRHLTSPGGHGWSGGGGGHGDAKADEIRKFRAQASEEMRFLQCTALANNYV